MIIRHSLKLLEQLSQLEDLIRKVEEVCIREKLNVDNEAVLEGLVFSWEKNSQLRKEN